MELGFHTKPQITNVPTISPGTKLGHYEILSQLGAGGMGEVYLAHDITLDRKVALKLLPTELASEQTECAALCRKRRLRPH